MLFSQPDVAQFINQTFEAAWQSVRPVPIVRIDFGKGNVLTRTLHGNIATYVCTADGKVLDILPGIYEPKTYLDRLRQFSLLSRWSNQQGGRPEDSTKQYHRIQAEMLRNGKTAVHFVARDFSKAGIERNVKIVLTPTSRPKASNSAGDNRAARKSPQVLTSPENVAGWKVLADDTRINETIRRQKIHEHLANRGLVSPINITKWLYREVLDADLDDPYLGLGKVLFADYPWRTEDAGE